jgi:hypothetical protein
MTWQEFIKKMAQRLAIGTAAFSLLLVILFGLTQTGAAKRKMASLLAARLTGSGEMRVEMGKMEGLIPFNLGMDRIAFSDADGQWLALEHVALQWRPLTLLRGRIHVTRLAAGTVQLDRLPLSEEEKEQKAPNGSLVWPKALERLTIDHLAVEELAVGEAIMGTSARLRLEAFAEGNHQPGALSVSARGKTGISSDISPFLGALLGNSMSFSGNLVLTAANRLLVQQFQVQTFASELSGSASVDLGEGNMEASWRLAVPRLAVLGPALGRGLEG